MSYGCRRLNINIQPQDDMVIERDEDKNIGKSVVSIENIIYTNSLFYWFVCDISQPAVGTLGTKQWSLPGIEFGATSV